LDQHDALGEGFLGETGLGFAVPDRASTSWRKRVFSGIG
jgi:hypothetical protein